MFIYVQKHTMANRVLKMRVMQGVHIPILVEFRM